MASMAPVQLVERLTATNYNVWALRMEHYLRKEGLWAVTSAPALPLAGGDVVKNEKALAAIMLSLGDEQLLLVADKTTAKSAWDALKGVFVQSTAGSVIALTRRLYRTVQKDGECVKRHLANLTDCFHELSLRGKVYSEEDKVYIILSSLSSQYNMLITALETSDPAVLSVNYVTGRLLEIQAREAENSRQSANPAGKAGKGGIVSSPPSNVGGNIASHSNLQHTGGQRHIKTEELASVSSVRKCFSCGSRNHLKKSCSKWLQQQRERTEEKGKSSKIAVVRHKSTHAPTNWVLDSGATQNYCNNTALLHDITNSEPKHVSMADGRKAEVACQGKMYFSDLKHTFDHVLCVPSLENNLLSIPVLDKEGFSVLFAKGVCTISKNGKVLGQGKLQGHNMYVMQNANNVQVVGNVKPHDNCIHLLHRRLGHASFKTINKTLEIVGKEKLKPCKAFLDCEVCKCTKSKAYPVARKSERVSTQPLQLVHGDVIGPLAKSCSEKRFALILTDDYSRYSWVYILKQKSDVCSTIKYWYKKVANQIGPLKALQTDQRGEFMSNELRDWLQRKGVKHRLANSSVPAENGVAERSNAVLQTLMASMLKDANLPNSYWGEALKASCFVKNRLWTSAIQNIPYCLMHGKRPRLDFLRTFGVKAWVNQPHSQRRKGADKAKKLTFVGYQPGMKAYRFADDHKQLRISRAASFCESQGWTRVAGEEEPLQVFLPLSSDTIPSDQGGVQASGSSEETEPQVLRRSERSTKGIPPDRYGDFLPSVNQVVYHEPVSYEEMLKLPAEERDRWHDAMQREMESLIENEVFSLVEAPKDKNIIGCRWLYKIKTMPEGKLQHKARLVAQGYSQQIGRDYDAIFSPTVKADTLKAALCKAGAENLTVHHFDFTTAYLNAPLKEELYLKQIPGFQQGKQSQVLKIHKALYGLHQSARI